MATSLRKRRTGWRSCARLSNSDTAARNAGCTRSIATTSTGLRGTPGTGGSNKRGGDWYSPCCGRKLTWG
eukprot:9478393-Lingulodinium_polyedra.AAC.1